MSSSAFFFFKGYVFGKLRLPASGEGLGDGWKTTPQVHGAVLRPCFTTAVGGASPSSGTHQHPPSCGAEVLPTVPLLGASMSSTFLPPQRTEASS